MKINNTIFTVMLVVLGTIGVQGQDPILDWVGSVGGAGTDNALHVTVDNNGNVYTTGYFEGTVDFDPSPAATMLTAVGGFDIFVQKMDANGNLLWVKQMGGNLTEYGYSIATDKYGNVYTMGYFQGMVDFDPSAATMNVVSNGFYDVFIQKLDANGNFQWVKQMGGTFDDYGTAMTIDTSGNLYTSGYFGDVVDFDPNAGTINLGSKGAFDFFVQKLDKNGNLIWAKSMGGTLPDYSNAMAIDPDRNVFLTGHFEGTADFDPGAGVANLTASVGYDIFIFQAR